MKMEDQPYDPVKIKTMKLYSHVDRIYAELKENGITKEDKLDASELNKYDQYHYHGTEAIDEAIKELGISYTDAVLDIGSGLGGPARYMATKTGCRVTAVEIQEDLHQTASDLTNRCGLSHLITHLFGNFIYMQEEIPEPHDFISSWLVFLHITNKTALFNRCYKSLKSGGKMYIEDYYSKSPLTDTEKSNLQNAVYCETAPTKEDYINDIKAAGFINIKFQDITDSWTEFVKGRHQMYIDNKERHIRVYGQEVYQEQEYFFHVVKELFMGGNLGGCKITAEKPAHDGKKDQF